MKDAAVRSAVAHILNCKKLEVPADFEWDRLPDFHAFEKLGEFFG